MVRSVFLIASVVALASCSAEPAKQAADEAAATPMNEAQAAYDAANQRMHAGMAAIDPDPDVAFMQGMLAHHRGAVEMSEVALKHGSDPEVKALAEKIIAAQQGEIAEMEAWLAKHGKAADTGSAAADPHAGH